MAEPQRLSLTAGTRIGGKYRLLRRLGEGAMGVVWAAQNEATLREVAVKLLPTDDATLRARLLREARACGQLRHRNVVEILDVETADNGDPFLVMELLAGETLAQRLKRGRRLPAPEAALIARDIARALAAAHGRRIIHRDLKPANIFLQDDEAGGYVVKVLDFGVSKDLATSDGLHTTAGAAIGSLAYMSPEQARAEPSVDHRTDLWAVGVVLFELLAGERPLKGSAPHIVLALARGEIPRLAQIAPDVDPGLAAIVDRCLQPRREDRFQSAQELAAQLDPHAAPMARASLSNEARLPPPSPQPSSPQLQPPPRPQQPSSPQLQPPPRPQQPSSPQLQYAPAPAPQPQPSSPDLLLGAGGTVRMDPEAARKVQQALAPKPQFTDESTTAPLAAKQPQPPAGPHGTALMLPYPATSPPARPLPPPPAPPPPPAASASAPAASPAPAPGALHVSSGAYPAAPQLRPAAPAPRGAAPALIALIAAVLAALVAVLAYTLLVRGAPWR